MISQGVRHPISPIGLCYSNDHKGGGGIWCPRLHLIEPPLFEMINCGKFDSYPPGAGSGDLRFTTQWPPTLAPLVAEMGETLCILFYH